jgi:hypothetical protein
MCLPHCSPHQQAAALQDLGVIALMEQLSLLLLHLQQAAAVAAAAAVCQLRQAAVRADQVRQLERE